VIRYLGSKKNLIPLILLIMREFKGLTRALDLFSGSARVGYALKSAGYKVCSNDLNAYAEVLARCYVEADAVDVVGDARKLIAEFNALPGDEGWFTQTYSHDSRFFQPANGARIDAIRNAIVEKGLRPELEAVLLTSLVEAADKVDSTMGLHKAYLKEWDSKSFSPLELRVPPVLPRAKGGKGKAFCMDALVAAGKIETDIAYLDPPYNNEKYLNLYHIWESLVLWDKPKVIGKAMRREDVKTRKSAFNAKREACDAMRAVVDRLQCKVMVVSFNNEGHISKEEMTEILSRRGHVHVVEQDYKRYSGATQGVYNHDGEKVGKVSHTENVEYIFVVSEDPAHIEGVKRVTHQPDILDFFS
jgi:adenine-specific DNA-methyltransferase